MNLSARLLLSVILIPCLFVKADPGRPSFTRTKDGIIVYTDHAITGKTQAVKLEVVAENIIRVIAVPGTEILVRHSLVTVYSADPNLRWETKEDTGFITLRTKQLTAVVRKSTGAVSFFDVSGKPILKEKDPHGRSFESAIYEGKPSWKTGQTFQSDSSDAWYGLGQHQDGILNYRGQQVNFFQNNTEVAVPFLVSPKNYGILWDNYSLTTAGNTQPFRPLATLALQSADGEPGWLTASYFNDAATASRPVIQKAEADINMEFLGDSRKTLPAEFDPAKGRVVWEGSIGSKISGVHKLRFIYGGYLRVWVDGHLLIDRWRKAWNPAPALVEVNLADNRQSALRIEWKPEGSESYLAVKWQEPLSPDEIDQFAFASEAGQCIDYYFIHGSGIDEVIAGYRKLTGKAPIVPKWALGFWQSRERYKTQKEILDVVAEFRKRKIPLDNIVLDWSYWKEAEWGSQDFDPARFPSPDSMIDVLHKKFNTRLMISVWPKFYEGISSYQQFDKEGWLYKRNIADRQRDWIGKGYVSTFYDAFNENARKGFWDLIHEKIYKKGIDAWWMDASEPDILSNVSPEKRKQQMSATALGPAAEVLNAYPLQNAKGIYEGQRSTDPDKRVFLLTRSGFAGSQRYAAAIWSGDIGATWHDMQAQITAGINFSLSGLPYWTMDIGGFVVEQRFEKPDAQNLEEWRELMTRWYQFGAFVPLFRSHGQYPYREIFNIAPESHPAYKSMLYYNQLRYRLMPYIYSLAGSAYHSDNTIMRGLVMDFAGDKKTWNISDEYMFGPSLLINPVYNYRSKSRSVYLPAGQGWYDFYSGKWYAGGQQIEAAAPYERMPVFVKAGAILPLGPDLQYTSEKPADTITLYVYQGSDGAFQLYEDDGLNYHYEKGEFSVIPFRYADKSGELQIGERTGKYPGMISKRVFRVAGISPAKPGAPGASVKFKQVTYDGRPLTIKL